MNSVKIMILATIVIGLPFIVSAQSTRENWARCADRNPDVRISGCTAVLQSRGATTDMLAVAFYSRGLGYEEKGQYDRAIKDYDQAIRLRPGFSEASKRRGIVFAESRQERVLQDCYRQEQNCDAALAALGQAINRNNRNADLYYQRGNLLSFLDRYDEATNDFAKSLSLVERDPGLNESVNSIRQRIDEMKARSQLEQRWVAYLKQIQADANYRNWAEKPYDSYVRTHSSARP